MEKTILVISIFLVGLSQMNAAAVPGITGPLHASCSVTWNWPAVDCESVQKSIVDQIKKWNTDDNCKSGGEKCLYSIKSITETSILANHMTPIKHYNDSLTFDFVKSQVSGCTVKGHSTSDIWYAVLDYGTNYCNLNNLITGAELQKVDGYTEATSDDICTQYSSADCNVY